MKQVQKQEQNQMQNQVNREQFQRTAAWLADSDLRESEPTAEAQTGKFPSTGTLRAEILAVLLASEDMAGLDSVFTGTHRLSTVIRALTRRYGWPIERHDFATNTVDGRAVWVTAYALPAETIAKALEHGAARWVEEVKAARRDRRQQASKRQYRFTPKDVMQLINSNIDQVKGNTP